MTATNEKHLWDCIQSSRETPRAIIGKMVESGMIANEKQAHRTLEKWVRQGKYEYGVTVDLGWLVTGKN